MAFIPNYYGGYQNPQQLVQQQARLNQLEQQMYQQSFQPQYQQPIQQPVQPSIGVNGRVVDDIGSVNFNEVSTDNNSPSVFIKKDLSEIYLKRYNQNGLIETFTYKLQVDEPEKTKDKNKSFEDTLTEFSVMFDDKLSSIEDKLNQALAKQSTAQKGGGR